MPILTYIVRGDPKYFPELKFMLFISKASSWSQDQTRNKLKIVFFLIKIVLMLVHFSEEITYLYDNVCRLKIQTLLNHAFPINVTLY